MDRCEQKGTVLRPELTVGGKSETNRIGRGEHDLLPIPYEYNALEPVLSSEQLYVHHREHHQSYIDQLNEAEETLVQMRQQGDYQSVRHWSRQLAYAGSGDILHVLYWYNMEPGGSEMPDDLAEQLRTDYGTVDDFRQHFTEAARRIAGNGWGVVVWQPMYGRTEILTAERHENMAQWGTFPLLVVDVWEHAYYIDYPAERDSYLQQWWEVVSWELVAVRFRWASKQ